MARNAAKDKIKMQRLLTIINLLTACKKPNEQSYEKRHEQDPMRHPTYENHKSYNVWTLCSLIPGQLNRE